MECNICYGYSLNGIKCVVNCSFIVCLTCYDQLNNKCPQCKSPYKSYNCTTPNGEGEIVLSRGSKYVGMIKNCMAEDPNGRLFREDGTLKFIGNITNNMLNGRGTEYYKSGHVRYIGYYNNGVKTGYGRYFRDVSGELYYDGYFKDNKPHGYGTVYNSDGTVFQIIT